MRGRVLARHRQDLVGGWQLTGELGLASDRNFLEQYFEYEWDTFKDQSTGFELKRLVDNTSMALSMDVRLNPYFTQTNQLPRFDHFQLGESLLGNTLTWYEHSSAEYAQMKVAEGWLGRQRKLWERRFDQLDSYLMKLKEEQSE